MIPVLSSSSPHLRDKWPEVSLLSQQQVMADPQLLRRAFNGASHTAVIIEGSADALTAEDMAGIQRRKRVKLPLLYNKQVIDTVFDKPIAVLSFAGKKEF